jgi:hypothetical protein
MLLGHRICNDYVGRGKCRCNAPSPSIQEIKPSDTELVKVMSKSILAIAVITDLKK